MDLSTIWIVIAVIFAFGTGLVLDVDTFAGGIFSILKGKKGKDEDK